jgi:hypothetical protein
MVLASLDEPLKDQEPSSHLLIITTVVVVSNYISC